MKNSTKKLIFIAFLLLASLFFGFRGEKEISFAMLGATTGAIFIDVKDEPENE